MTGIGAIFLAVVSIGASTLRVSTPLVFGALGGLFSERSGIVNIALEGMMLVGAFAAAAVTAGTHSPWLGALAGMIAGAGLGAAYAFCVIELRSDQIVAGMGINLLAAGFTAFFCKVLYGSTTASPAIPIEERFHSAPHFAAWTLVLLTWIWYTRFRSGLWLRFAGEKPEALEAAGIRVRRVRWFAVIMSGVLAGAGGAVLSISLSSSFTRNMTAGRGFMALAALIFGRWHPIRAALACLLFGFADALSIRLQGVTLWGTNPVPVQFIQILPYVVTVLVLAGMAGQSGAPRALGRSSS